MDLVWGYAGVLSLCHAMFFALGGYAMGMYLMRAIGTEGNYRSSLPDFMVFLDWKELPWYWYGFNRFGFALVDGAARARSRRVRLRLLRLPFAHRRASTSRSSRRR